MFTFIFLVFITHVDRIDFYFYFHGNWVWWKFATPSHLPTDLADFAEKQLQMRPIESYGGRHGPKKNSL